jgi:hypothetical protein
MKMAVNPSFVDMAYSSVVHMHEAMNALEGGAPAVKTLAANWNITLSDADAQALVTEYGNVKQKPICELRATKMC